VRLRTINVGLPDLNCRFEPRDPSCVTPVPIEPGVKVYVNAPGADALATVKETTLIFYALPNGNTTAQTLGRATNFAGDWRYDIQHIGAQTRFLRNLLPDNAIISRVPGKRPPELASLAEEIRRQIHPRNNRFRFKRLSPGLQLKPS